MNAPTPPDFDPHESEERLRFALDAARLGQWDLDLRTGWADRTLRHDQIFGYLELLPEWTYDHFLVHVVPEERATVDEAFQRAFRDSGFWDVRCRIRRADGEVRHIWTRARIQRDAAGHVERMLGIVGDDTERHHTEAALLESDARLRLLDAIGEATRKMVDAQSVVDLTMRMVGEYLRASRCAYADVEPDGDHLTIHPEWKLPGLASAAGHYSLDLFGKRSSVELRRGNTLVIHDVDGELAAADGAQMFNAIGIKAIITAPLVRDGRLLALIAVHSVTSRAWTRDEVALLESVVERTWAHVERVRAQAELSKREAWLHNLIGAVPGALWTATPEGDVDFTTRWMHDFTGRTSEHFRSSSWPEFMHPDDLPGLLQCWAQARSTSQPYAFECRFRRADGVYRWLDLRAIPSFDDQNNVVRWYGTALDVDEQKQTRALLEASESALRDADRRKDEFLATLAHELRNPLAPIGNGLHLLRLAGSDAALTGRALDVMQRQFGQLVRLVDDLLDVSRVSRDVVELRREHLALSSVLESAVEMSRPLIEANGVDLQVVAPADPLMLDADATRLGQVFCNLLNNAAKFSRGGGHIWLETRCVGGVAEVSVRDDGIGMAPELLPRVFDLFAQGDHSLERNRGGLGIGLTLARRLVELHGGSIRAHSPGLGAGSEFVVELPLSVQAPVATNDDAPAAIKAPSAGLRIAVADDNADAADGLAQLLDLLGHEVRVAYDGLQALALAEEFRPDVMLLDIGMPRLNGLDTARRLRAEPWGATLTLIALSGWGQAEDRERSIEAGFDHHLVKPLNLQLLEPLLANLAKASRPDGPEPTYRCR